MPNDLIVLSRYNESPGLPASRHLCFGRFSLKPHNNYSDAESFLYGCRRSLERELCSKRESEAEPASQDM